MAAVTEIPPITAAPPPPQPRPRVLVVGSLAASVSTAMCLVGLIGIYLARRADVVNTGEAWIPRGLDAQLAQPTMVMLTFGLSIITAVWMIDALRRDDRQHAWIATGLTMMFGLAIVNQVTYSLGLLGASTETEPGTLIL
ncbi:MAG: hypothetical protein OEY23_06745, partial [Acidimicrobiia bacterium]|nr:hypothetical protein [Acidimicrobiia bacterium]